jgi:ribosomal protein S18 acetylase RimI-like enzyme
MASPLDNPIWHALIGPQAGFAIGQGAARCYRPDVAAFAAFAEPTPAAYGDLTALLPRGQDVILFRPDHEPLPPGWEASDARLLEQMILPSRDVLPRPPSANFDVIPLGLADAADMLNLVAITRPGPFAPQTVTLGRYIGVRDRNGRLVAMAGERMRLPGHVEVSAICVHPDAQGRGLGAALTLDIANAAFDRGETPFLHVWPDNPAKSLYRRLGFRLRTSLWVLVRRPFHHA